MPGTVLDYAAEGSPKRRPFYKNLTVQVLTAIFVGLLIGAVWPEWGRALQPLGDGFIRLVKMVVGPLIFLTIVGGIASMDDMKKVGRVGGKALLYFEIVTTLALGIGLLVGNVFKPGSGIHATPTTGPTAQVLPATESAKVAEFSDKAKSQSTTEFLLNIIPENIVGSFAKGDLLPILFFSVLFGLAVAKLGMKQSGIVRGVNQLTRAMFGVVSLVMKVAPLGALGAMAYTVGKFGVSALLPLMKLMACVYATMALFIVIVLGIICRLFGFRLWPFLVYIREEILLVLGTSSSESALPRMMEKMEQCGCSRGVVGMVIPAGYSFNLDGTSIYLSMAVLFIAQAFGVHLGFWQQMSIIGILMLTSKGAAAVTGGGFVCLAATLSATHVLPIEGLALLLGVDRFMSEARAITNLIGNGVATVVVSKMEGEFDPARFSAAMLASPSDAPVASGLAKNSAVAVEG
jgi:aerobic C4-dicarboxylate transport protein